MKKLVKQKSLQTILLDDGYEIINKLLSYIAALEKYTIVQSKSSDVVKMMHERGEVREQIKNFVDRYKENTGDKENSAEDHSKQIKRKREIINDVDKTKAKSKTSRETSDSVSQEQS